MPENNGQDKKIVVNHIAVTYDSQGEKKFSIIGTETPPTLKLKNANDSYKYVNELYLKGDGTLTTNSSDGVKLLQKKEKLASGMYMYTIKAPAKETAYQVDDLVEKGRISSEYKFIGRKIDIQTNIDGIVNLQSYIVSNYNDGKDLKTIENGFTLNNNNNEDEVIVNMYYEVETQEITVEHRVCKNSEFKDLDIKVIEGCSDYYIVEGNREIEVSKSSDDTDKKTIYYTNPDNKKETYLVNKGSIITAKKSDSSYEYKGYIAKTYIDGERRYYIPNTEPEIKIGNKDSDKIEIVFWYFSKMKSDEEIKESPTPNIPGTLSILSTRPTARTCRELYSVPTNARNSENDIYVGIKGTPTYVLAGINVEKQDTEQTITFNITMSFGPNSKTWKIEVPYSLSYYAIQNLLMYKYQLAEIYNSGSSNTEGDILFENNTLTISPINTSKLILDSINGTKTISNNSNELNNWKNYITTSYRLNSIINRSYVPVPDDNDENSEKNYIRNKILPSNKIIDSNTKEAYKINISGAANKQGYSGSYGVKKNNIGSYITFKVNGKIIDKEKLNMSENEFIIINNDTRMVNIDIALLTDGAGKNIFDQISDESGEISITGLLDRISNTNGAIKSFIEARDDLKTAYDNYIDECYDSNHGKTLCYSACESAYESALNTCENKCSSWDDCKDSNGDKIEGCTPGCAEYYACGDSPAICQTCQNHLNHKDGIMAKATSYNSALEEYNSTRSALDNAYKAEKFAVQNFDEAYFLQKMWFEDATDGLIKKDGESKGICDYTSVDIANLLGLGLKLDFSSGNAKVGEIYLMTVVAGEVTLSSEGKIGDASTFNLVSENNDINISSGNKLFSNVDATEGGATKNSIVPVALVAKRQTMTNTQKDYYKTGIPNAAWINNVDKVYYQDKQTGKDNSYKIPITRLNGTRILAGKADYKIDGTNKVGNKTVVTDNMYYGISSDTNEDGSTKETLGVFDVSTNSSFSKYYGVKEKNSEEFNVYTPLKVQATVNQDIDIINQTVANNYSNTDVIQANSTFTVNFTYQGTGNYSNPAGDFTSRYKHATYIKFEFAVTNVKYEDSEGYERSYGSYNANEWIGPIYGNYITAVPYLNTIQGQSITDMKYNYYVVATAVNTRDSWTRQLLGYINTKLRDLKNQNLISVLENVCGDEGGKKLSYYADTDGSLIIVNRIYDFRVTDLKDLDWKNVFRDNTSSSYVNQHSGIAYYAGLSKWNTKNPLKYNQIIGRTADEIGTNKARILPLGPYKNTDSSYISAPKMGYRFSFDLKVSGEGKSEKFVQINPSFYYISKDGKTFYTEGIGGIYLFYKNSKGQYVRVGSTSDEYKIQFTPNDGYRSLIQTDVKNLNSNVVTLGSLRKLILNYSETTTVSKNDAAITYYGEYKLPNSTIAVKVDSNGNYDINRPLTDGYIGVIFDIVAHESDGVDLSYSKNSYKGLTNTSQWDYEGYLGMDKPQKEYSTTMKLEKGIWTIDNDIYNKIKGTVILYDTDKRASNDFN